MEVEEEGGREGGGPPLFVAASPFVVPLAKFLNRFVAEQECSDQVGREGGREGWMRRSRNVRLLHRFTSNPTLPPSLPPSLPPPPP